MIPDTNQIYPFQSFSSFDGGDFYNTVKQLLTFCAILEGWIGWGWPSLESGLHQNQTL